LDPSTEAKEFARWSKEVQDINDKHSVGVNTLHHETYPGSLGILKKSIALLRSKGYRFVTVDECLFPKGRPHSFVSGLEELKNTGENDKDLPVLWE
jgi:peptidoglycan/xylan/chitin deacetylase (PgdA/CDA1 family)